MARGTLRSRPLPKEEQFSQLQDLRIRRSLIALSDRYDEGVRTMIANAYKDPGLHAIWRNIRRSGKYDKGGKSKVHRKILEFPNGYIFDFVDTVMTELYGNDWLNNRQALRHDLVRPWWVVSNL